MKTKSIFKATVMFFIAKLFIMSEIAAEEWYIPKTAEILEKGKLQAGLRFQLSGNEEGILDTQEISLIPSVRYSFTNRFELYAQIPVSHMSQDQIAGFIVEEKNDEEIGDLFLQATLELAGKANWKISALADVSAPTGKNPYENEIGFGNGYWTVTPGLNFSYVSDPVILFTYLGYQHGFSETFDVNETATKIEPGRSVRLRTGASVAFNPRLNGSIYTALDFRSSTKQDDLKVAESSDTLARVGLSLGFNARDDLSLGLSTVFGLNDSTSDYVVSFGITYTFF